MEIFKRIRKLTSAFERVIKNYVVLPAKALAGLSQAISRIEDIDRRTTKLEEIDRQLSKLQLDLRNLLPFDQEFSLSGIDLFGNNLLSIKQDWPLSNTQFSSRITSNSQAPIPPLSSRARIQGAKCVENNPEDDRFLGSGVTNLRAVFNIAGVFGVDLDRNLSVLDFGVGCARMARHLPPGARDGLMGVDVDPVNIDWCIQNMPFGRYEAIRPGSTIPAPDRSFDLIYSFSVFTHLSPGEQDHWLKELARVSKGLIILSVHGLYSSFKIASWSRDPKYLGAWLKEGFVDAGVPNPDISDVVDKDYYRDVAHTPSYIRSRWSMYLDVVEIIPGGIGQIQDAVVLRNKSGSSLTMRNSGE